MTRLPGRRYLTGSLLPAMLGDMSSPYETEAPMIGFTITFRKWYDPKRTMTGTVIGVLANGNLKVRTMHKAARGGTWAATDLPVKPSEVIAS